VQYALSAVSRNFLLLFVASVLFVACTTNPKDKIVGIQPLGYVTPSTLKHISDSIRKAYNVKVYMLPAHDIPKSAFVNIKTPRYRADKIIKLLKENKPDSVDYIVAITASDISVTKTDSFGKIKSPREKYEDWGVFGYGYVPGPSCIVSTFRLKNPQGKFVDRITKVAIHELGHNFGLPHCDSERCVMSDAAETIKTIDVESNKLCERCKERLAD
jgi:archaemetzincin